ncbi:MAG: Fe-S cluster assembly protein SufD [Betaproteobacteria bacterium HGW-Betaproteobacteria-12]|nr:MAG: Fe-S cluster assembly protein SufD [Betaproteobacteria bacterium HGW-Betaproteobacteria-12]
MNARQVAGAVDYLAAFEQFGHALPGQHVDWLAEARAEAIGRFAQQGFPSQRDEDWKYTSVSGIENGHFAVNIPPAAAEPALAALVAAQTLPDSHLLVFVDGRLAPELCRPGRLPAGVVLGSLAAQIEAGAPELEEHLVCYPPPSAFADLNLAFMADGAYLRLPPGATVKAPIQWLFVARTAASAVQPRNLVLAGEGSAAVIVEQHVALTADSYFTNVVSDLVLAAGASLEHHKLQQENARAFHIATVNVAQAAGSHFVSGAYAFGGRLARTGIAVALQGEGAACTLDGLYVTDGRQHVDHHTRIDHRQPGCTSRELYKGVLAGAARAVFSGRIVVHPDAQGSDARQTNHNLLLSEQAEIDSKPQLEIWADDVQCSHGATVGQLDEDQVFYLRARGLAEATARLMLTRAFAMEVVGRVGPFAVQERLDAVLQDRLPRA